MFLLDWMDKLFENPTYGKLRADLEQKSDVLRNVLRQRDELIRQHADLHKAMNAQTASDLKIIEGLRREFVETLESRNHAANLYARCLKERDEAIEETRGAKLAFAESYEGGMIALSERDEARRYLAALQQKHATLIHAVNDAAMLANELPEINACGEGASNGTPRWGDPE